VIEGAMGFMMDLSVFKSRAEDARVQQRQEDLGRQDLAKVRLLRALFEDSCTDGPQISHDICDPVAGIVTMAERLLADDKLGEKSRNLANNIHHSATSLLASINDILDSSRPEKRAIGH
jgi:signal transduction histidine kinase